MYVIEATKIGKKYKRYSNQVHRLLEWMTGDKRHEEKWVLRDVTFNVSEGESIGIIGHNGAGKSTLLKVLTGTTRLSEGSMSVRGRVSALLELGVGFHPDFTGLQNVYMTGQLMGMSSKEIGSVLPDILEFAEIGDYLYQPVRTYSSGMMVRLAFSVVTSIRPDILIVDEALSVGDTYFQHKCFRRIRKYREQGTSLLFVSHDPIAVKNLCDKAILLDQGLMIKQGEPDEVLDYYNAIIAKREADEEIKQSLGMNNKLQIRSGNEEAVIAAVDILSNHTLVNAIQVGESIDIRLTIKSNKEINNPTVGFIIKDRLGNDIYGTNTFHMKENLGRWSSGEQIIVTFNVPANLGVGTYSVTVAAHDSYEHIDKNYDWIEQAATFQVISGSEPPFVGVSNLPVSVHMDKGGTVHAGS